MAIAPSRDHSVLDSFFFNKSIYYKTTSTRVMTTQESINKNEAKMKILSNSWAQHLNSLAGNNEANKNMMAF
jgi:hypothetical protein